MSKAFFLFHDSGILFSFGLEFLLNDFSFGLEWKTFFRVLKMMLFCLPLFLDSHSRGGKKRAGLPRLICSRKTLLVGYFMAIIYVVNLSCKQRANRPKKKSPRKISFASFQFNATIYSYTMGNNKVVVHFGTWIILIISSIVAMEGK